MRSTRTTLIVAALVGLPLALAGCAGEAPEAAMEAAPAPSMRAPIVGTYQLVGRNVKDESGAWAPVEDFNSLGYITYSDRGYMAVNVMPLDREPFADDGEPTAEEVHAALQGYTAYYGPFSVEEDADGGYLIHHRIGQINPGGEVDAKRYYDIEGDRLILTPASETGMKSDAARQVVWERLPDVELSAEAQRFLGMRELLYTDSYVVEDGAPVESGNRNEDRAGSWILYTPTGHMMVHLMAREGRTPYAGDTPTPEESLAAYRTYGGYFGPFTVHEDADPPYVVHHQEGRTRPVSGVTDAERLYQLDGDVLRLGGRPRTNEDGETVGGHLYWELLPHRPE
ncbi:MAG: lipocalin-like domain-containing protein [Acidobacteria bacterium]|nr:lipocalin-like domain-containing protein [Acidobacteriota bacterium]